jgi:tRNA A37 N6-isopentenylltransferase MiaA
MRFLDGEISLDEATELFKTAHWQYARRQKSWFKTNPYITWLNNDSDGLDTIIGEVKPY